MVGVFLGVFFGIRRENIESDRLQQALASERAGRVNAEAESRKVKEKLGEVMAQLKQASEHQEVLASQLARLRSEHDESQASLAEYAGTGLTPEQVLSMNRQFRQLQAALDATQDERRVLGQKSTRLQTELDRYVSPEKSIPPDAVRTGESALPAADSGSDLPIFPLPPPRYTCYEELDRSLVFTTNVNETLGNVADRLARAFRAAEYSQFSFYSLTNNRGFALLAQLEQIRTDGSFTKHRWVLDVEPPDHFDLAWYIKALFFGRPGYYRVIVFLVTDLPFGQGEVLTETKAKELLRGEEVNIDNNHLADLSFNSNFKYNSLIYEFEKSETSQSPFFRETSVVGTARMHLEGAHLLSALLH